MTALLAEDSRDRQCSRVRCRSVALHSSEAAIVLPRVAEYLAPLPAGVASHPGCLAKAALLRRALAERPLARDHVAALPPVVGAVVTCPPLDGEWVPDVWLMCALLAIADAYKMSDEEHLRWIREMNGRMFNTLFRLLMKAVSPEYLVRRAPERWSVFHRGSTLAITDAAPGRCTAHLEFPPWLFHGLALRQFVAVFEAALQMNDPEGRLELAGSDAVGARFTVTWRPSARISLESRK
jgi:hypothetical protein